GRRRDGTGQFRDRRRRPLGLPRQRQRLLPRRGDERRLPAGIRRLLLRDEQRPAQPAAPAGRTAGRQRRQREPSRPVGGGGGAHHRTRGGGRGTRRRG